MNYKSSEIELKTMLTQNEYTKIISNYKIDAKINFQQFYLYFSKQEGELVRLRKYDTKIELTRKTRIKIASNIENNIAIEDETYHSIITKPDLIFNYWPDLHKEKLINIAGATISRSIVYHDDYTLMIDKTIFQDNYIDYELEVEFKNEQDIKNIFNSILVQNSIQKKQSITKIERTLNRRKK
jgi:uncharacterized protein YjbK